ncbi:DUF5605 domain-containing protein [Paenibacillus arenilitoris]|uniref:DUF5605 domain-containing protein n=1 Tax=Paenibacillus arenilitoris TaxID=2772299 RepID=A0A927H458_9BACL|nr:DUF5605 domain-containing protein [Paenibacillus arenilitoris]MBD2867123.1 DUF5605 domain-containing protein [Paenibacillus arenilitoris]
MTYTEKTRIGILYKNDAARGIIVRRIPALQTAAPHIASLFKSLSLEQYYRIRQEELSQPDWIAETLSELADVPHDPASLEPEPDIIPSAEYESAGVPAGSAFVRAPAEAEQWGVYEIELSGPSHGNPMTDVALAAEFRSGDKTVRMAGFYDGDGVFRIRFMPDVQGDWTFRTTSNARSLDGIEGAFRSVEPSPGNHGPLRVKDTFHFAYADGTSYIPVGTTCYAWTHQGDELEEQTLETLKASPFNKLRMCVFPKSYLFNENEPVYYPFEGSLAEGWDYTRPNPAFFRHLEKRIAELGELGIEADLILFHPYDRWGYSEMPAAADDRYLRYITARLSAYRNVWWSLANEYDLMWSKGEEDWERFAAIVTDNDPAGHLISNHNCLSFFDYGKPWVTHCSIQRIDVYKTSEATNEWREKWNKPIVIDECAYEGDIDQGWGNISGEEMTRRFWEGAVRGGYVGHGETYLNAEQILWWSKGGKLTGTSPERIAFLRGITEESPGGVLNPLPSDWDVPCAGVKDEYYLYYFGFNQPRFRNFNRKPGIRFRVEVIDSWNMTIEKLPGTFEGTFRIELPGKPFMAVRLTKVDTIG